MEPRRLSGYGFGANNETRSSRLAADFDNNYTNRFDFVMVFPMIEEKSTKQLVQSPEAKYYCRSMLDAGLCLYTYLSVQEDELIVLIHVPDAKVKVFADLVDYPTMIDPSELRKALLAGNPEAKIKPIDIKHDPAITPLEPFQYIYCKFETSFPEEFYFHYDGKLFPKFIKLKLLYEILRAPFRGLGGANIPITSLIHKKRITGFYPLHNKIHSMALLEEQLDWTRTPWNQPFEDIRGYYGEKIALYHLFLGHFSEFLILPSFIGFAFQIVVWATLNFSSPVLPFFAVVITVGSIIMLEGWKRKESFTALKWGMSDFESRELERPEFTGVEIKSFVTGEDIIYFPPADFRTRVQFSFCMIGLMIMLVIGVVASIYYLRFSLQKDIGSSSSAVASVLNTAQIIIFNMIYQFLVQKLTNLENHRTDTSYQDSMIVKLFLFQFVNSYASFFFLAFVAQYLPKPDGVPDDFVGQCGADNCMYPLSINLAIIFGTKLVITNVVALGQPYVLQKLKLRKETKGEKAKGKQLTPAEEDYMLLPYDPMMDNISNYAETAVQFGFMVLFITALPIGCFFSVVNSYVKIRVDTYKLTHFYQRPIPAGAQDIGTWQDIFNIICVVSVITNGALVCFTMDVLALRGWTASGRIWIFIGFQWVLISLQFIAAYAIPDVPEVVEIQLERTEFINSKVVLKVADEEFDEEEPEPESPRQAEATDEDPLTSEPLKTGCCGRTLKPKKVKKLKGAAQLEPITTFEYPTSKGSSWPEMMSNPAALAKPPGEKSPR